MTIDPAQFLPAALREKATVEFADASVDELAAWLRKERGLQVVVHAETIAKECDIAPAPADGPDWTVPLRYDQERPFDGEDKAVEPVLRFTSRLDDAPLYLLLDRLAEWELGWWYENEVLHLSSKSDPSRPFVAKTYPIGDLLDQGFKAERITDLITWIISPDSWVKAGVGNGEVLLMGNFLLVVQDNRVQRHLASFLQGLRTHGRQTWVSVPAEHEALRMKLRQPVTVDYTGTPLEEAIADLGRQVGIPLRISSEAKHAIQAYESLNGPIQINLHLSNHPLRATIEAMTKDLGGELKMTCASCSGALHITPKDYAPRPPYLAVAVYDTRDLCPEGGDSDSLLDSISTFLESQPDESWGMTQGGFEVDMLWSSPGVLVLLHEERGHAKVLELLELFRETLRNHPPRRHADDEPITAYYRLEREMAEQLAPVLPELAAPDSWGEGTSIRCIASGPLNPGVDKADESPCSVLIIRQTRAVHREIREVLRRVAGGDYNTENDGLYQGIGRSYAVDPEPASP